MDELKKKLKIHKIVATRSLKTPSGDIFCGLSASFQPDGLGAGVDLLSEDEDMSSGMTVRDIGPVFQYLQLRAFTQCVEAAVAEGSLPEATGKSMIVQAAQDFAKLLHRGLARTAEAPSHAGTNDG